MERWFITMFDHSWGRGNTPEEAKANAKKAGGRGDAWITKELPAGATEPWVDNFGGINWSWKDGKEPEGYEHKALPIVAMGRGARRNARCRSCGALYDMALRAPKCKPTCEYEKATA